MNLLRRVAVALLWASFAGACSDERSTTPDASVAGFDAPRFDALSIGVTAADAAFARDATADAVSDATADGGIRCMPNSLRCVYEATAERCAGTGDDWLPLACTNGCVADGCRPSVLATGWTPHQFTAPDDSAPGLASYVFSDDKLTATQISNSMGAAYLLDQDLQGVEVTGKLGVHSDKDDDLIGFVFGWQDPQHFYLFDWKQLTQASPACGTANAGAALKVVKSDSAVGACADFWNSTGTGKVTPVSDPAKNLNGWKDLTTYSFRLVFRPGDIRIELKEDGVTVVSITSKDTTYAQGKFGLYSYSQEAVRYESIRLQPASAL